MKILLINPNREMMPWPVLPVGLATVASALEAAGHDVELLDLTFSKNPARDVRSAVSRRRPSLVGLGIRNLDNCNFERPVLYLPEIRDQVVRVVRRHVPDAPLVIGGAAVNVCPSEILDYLGADFAVVGEGEEAMAALCARLERGEDPTLDPGVLASSSGRKALPLLDEVQGRRAVAARAVVPSDRMRPSGAFRWVDVARYAALGASYPIQTKRGCAQSCSYCVYNQIEGRSYRLRSPDDVADEIEEVAGHGVRTFEIVDSTFNLPMGHALAVCRAIEERRLSVQISTMGLNPVGVTVELLEAMKRAGFSSVMCTPESASDVTLKSLSKGFDKQAVERAAVALGRAGMPTWWFFLLGAPGETLDTVRETLAFCEAHVPETDMVLLSTGIRVHPDTPLARHCQETGWFAQGDPLFEPSWYVSPQLELGALYDVLIEAAAKHPNWMTNAETVVSPRLASLIKHSFRAVGWRGPFWRHLPKLFKLSTRVGSRQKGLAVAADSMRRVDGVQHRR